MKAIDLQAHTTASDGSLSPAEVVRLAADAGVEVLSISDHDAVDGVPEALRAAEGLGIELVPAVELSATHPLAGDLHVLGYWIDIESGELLEALERAQKDRIERAHRMSKSLATQGVSLSVDAAIAESGGARALGRPHLAAAALAEPANSDVLHEVDDVSTFIRRYLVPGKEAFAARGWPTVARAIEVIGESGGTAVWAHPFLDLMEPRDVSELLDELQGAGILGVETFYPSHSREQTSFLLDECRGRGLAATASSDFHGPEHRLFSSFLSYETYGLGEPQVPPGGKRGGVNS